MNYDFNSRVSVRNAMIKSSQLNTDVFISFVVSRVHSRWIQIWPLRIAVTVSFTHLSSHSPAELPGIPCCGFSMFLSAFFSSSAVVISLLSGFPLCVTHVIKSPSKPHTSPQCQRIANTAYQSCDQSHQACPSHKGWTVGRGIHINHTWQG